MGQTREETLEEMRRLLEICQGRVKKGQFRRECIPSPDKSDLEHFFDELEMRAGAYSRWLWLVESARVLDVRSIKEAISSAKDRRRANSSIHDKECYMNSLKVCRKLGANYCEGYVLWNDLSSFHKHAWNNLNGVYFDVTSETVLNQNWEGTFHLLSIEFPPDEALALNKELYRDSRWASPADCYFHMYVEPNFHWIPRRKRR